MGVVTNGCLISLTRMEFAGEMRAKGDKIPLFSFGQDSGCDQAKHFGRTPFLTDHVIGDGERGFEDDRKTFQMMSGLYIL